MRKFLDLVRSHMKTASPSPSYQAIVIRFRKYWIRQLEQRHVHIHNYTIDKFNKANLIFNQKHLEPKSLSPPWTFNLAYHKELIQFYRKYILLHNHNERENSKLQNAGTRFSSKMFENCTILSCQ